MFEKGDGSKIKPEHREKIRRILYILDRTKTIDDIASVPSLHLHQLKGDRKGEWAVKITGNWRITFTFEDGDVYDVNYEDYH